MKEIKIGRHRDSDIRVNIPSVSRDHVRIYKDENGEVSYKVIGYRSKIFSHNISFFQCNIQNVSGTNVTTVNGQAVEDFVILKDGDVFCVGLRQFTYQNGGEIFWKVIISVKAN
jgi:pSer/pThr/pTyr-binding forkhead associated (FHA) protein